MNMNQMKVNMNYVKSVNMNIMKYVNVMNMGGDMGTVMRKKDMDLDIINYAEMPDPSGYGQSRTGIKITNDARAGQVAE